MSVNTGEDKNVKGYFTSSLEKIFCDEPFCGSEKTSGSMLLNERYSFQLAFASLNDDIKQNFLYSVKSPIKEFISVKLVYSEPAQLVCWADCDDYLLRKTPGLYPDILREYPIHGIKLIKGQWQSLWITVDPKNEIKAGEYPIEISLFEFDNEDKPIISKTFNINIINAALPEQELIYTRWFHYDCIANYYNLEVFSEEFWKMTENFIKTASDYGVNTMLTPLFTPPLDTQIGGERKTIQLVDVEKSKDCYTFNFDKLTRFISMCKRNKIKYFEFSHLFTQWGAKAAPKIIGKVNGENQNLFGWQTASNDPEYENFLDKFLSSLVEYIKQNNLSDFVFFHVSDEPNEETVNNYLHGTKILRRHIGGMKIIDAGSNYEIYKTGCLDLAIPATDAIEKFIENKVPDLWTYYCTSQYNDVSNQFLNMPSARNRIIGLQLYKYDIKGFLHWGYNFWNSFLSIESIDPFAVSDAGGVFQGGDAFAVYPGKNGAIPSIRLTVFYEALQDLSALKLLEQKIGRTEALKLIEDGLESEITFKNYPHSAEWLISAREKINKKIDELC